ncbi:4'-phosphopantetheinyl transferase superfamily protein [Schlesneria sp. DSM 10557]|uniref:4'-phosphopantetheinyl transferase family protein n=1 Tax=Schlesneria sp. DSM 10557 TaxID=3044399 RepID=UPI0035A08930
MSTLVNSDWLPISLPLELSADVVHVVRLKLDLPLEHWLPFSDVLSEEERQRAARFRFDEPRRQFVTCRGTLRKLLGSLCRISPNAIEFQYGPHGKPGLMVRQADSRISELQFSVSHSGSLGLIALSVGKAVGVDVEEFSPAVKHHQLAERYFAPPEAQELKRLPAELQLSGFYRGWTCKEAYIKALGTGLSHSLSSFQVTIDPARPASLCHIDGKPREPDRWTAMALDVGARYAAALMIAEPNCRVQCWDWSVT